MVQITNIRKLIINQNLLRYVTSLIDGINHQDVSQLEPSNIPATRLSCSGNGEQERRKKPQN